LSLLLDKVMN